MSDLSSSSPMIAIAKLHASSKIIAVKSQLSHPLQGPYGTRLFWCAIWMNDTVHNFWMHWYLTWWQPNINGASTNFFCTELVSFATPDPKHNPDFQLQFMVKLRVPLWLIHSLIWTSKDIDEHLPGGGSSNFGKPSYVQGRYGSHLH